MPRAVGNAESQARSAPRSCGEEFREALPQVTVSDIVAECEGQV